LAADIIKEAVGASRDSSLRQALQASVGPDDNQKDGEKVMKRAIRMAIQQRLKDCQSLQELIRITSRALSEPIAAQEFFSILGSVATTFQALLSRRDQDLGSASSILQALNTILYRLRTSKPAPDPAVEEEFLNSALEVAATLGAPRALWTYLQQCRRADLSIHPLRFAGICEGLSSWIGKHKVDTSSTVHPEILQVMFGRDVGASPIAEEGSWTKPYHLESWLHRSSMEGYVSSVDVLEAHASWLHLLSVTGSQSKLWSEWELWLVDPLRKGTESWPSEAARTHDGKFIRAMEPLSAALAWHIFHQSELRLVDLPKDLRFDLAMNPPPGTEWTVELEEASLGMLERQLNQVEAEYGVWWDTSGEGEGAHRKTPDHIIWALEQDLATDKDKAEV
jgi:hypothetical protein